MPCVRRRGSELTVGRLQTVPVGLGRGLGSVPVPAAGEVDGFASDLQGAATAYEQSEQVGGGPVG